MNSKSLSARVPDKYVSHKKTSCKRLRQKFFAEVAVIILAKIQAAYHFLCWFWNGPFRLFSNVQWCLGGRITPV